MRENVSDAYAFAAVMCLPLLTWVISRPPVWRRVRPRLESVALRAWRQVVVEEQPDEALLREWATERLKQLRTHLERVRRLILNDEWMTATRQVANRLAHEHLVHDVHEAELALGRFGPVEAWLAPAAPIPLSSSRFAFSAPAARPVVEVIEFGPSSHWR